MLPSKIAFVDIETTGLNLNYDRIIEIGVLRVENNQLVKTYQTLINPGCYISPMISQMTGITKESLENAPMFSEIKEQLQEILEDCTFVAHNVRFDYGFIRNEFKRFGIPYTSKHFCTVKLSRYLFPHLPKHNLDSIIQRFNIPVKNRHRAFDDAQVLWEFIKILQFQIQPEKLKEAIDLILKKPSIPSNIPIKAIEDLPEQPGVYLFYGSEGVPLYIGKSINIRERVLSHFASDHSSSKEMNIAQQIRYIETIPTTGELGALIKESYLVKKLQPFYNRQLRLKKNITIIKNKTNQDGYYEAVISTIDKITADEASSILGIFRSVKQAKECLVSLVKKHELCEKLLNLEKTKNSCFAYKLSICKGACLKYEDPLFYNLRFTNAFSQNKIKTWPFNTPIIVTEKNDLEETIESFLIDKWCLLGTISSDEDITSSHLTQEYNFDLDTYKIIHSFIYNPKNLRKIKPLTTSQAFQLPIEKSF